MKEINRRKFLKTIGTLATGGLFFPYSVFAAESPGKKDDFSKDSDQVLLARMIFGEARNEFDENIVEDSLEPIMIGYTAINRAEDKIKQNGKTLKEVILKNQPKTIKLKNGKEKTIFIHQYSCFNSWDPNLKRIENPIKYNPEAWRKSLILADKIIDGKLDHLNYGQSHYHLKNMKEYPSWTKSPRMKKVWSQPYFKHIFYKDKFA